MPTNVSKGTLGRRWYAILPSAQDMLEWLWRNVVQHDDAPVERWQMWWGTLDWLHAQGKLSHVALPDNVEFITALDGAIQHEVGAGLLTDADQLVLMGRLRDYVSPAVALRNANLRHSAKLGGAARSSWTDTEKDLVAKAVEQAIERNRKLSVSAAAQDVLDKIKAGKLRDVRRPDKSERRTLSKRTIERWTAARRKV
jgi:hypothetical protein